MSVSNYSRIQKAYGLELLLAVLYVVPSHVVGFKPSNQFTPNRAMYLDTSTRTYITWVIIGLFYITS